MRARTVGALVAIVAVVGAATGCVPQRAGHPVSIYENPDTVAGLPVTRGPSGLRPGAAATALSLRGGDDGTPDRIALAAVQDIQTFWDTEFPRHFAGTAGHVADIVSWDSTASNEGAPPFCGLPTAGLVNAVYCRAENTIGWDRGGLLPALIRAFGPMSVVMVLAHEYGHAVQRRAALIGDRDPVIVGEQQADCFAGAFIRHVAEGRAAHFTLDTSDGLNSVLAAAISIRDNPGDPIGAHGSAFERVGAVQNGFTDGPAACAKIDRAGVAHARATMPPWFLLWTDDGELPVTTASLASMVTALRGIFPIADEPKIDFHSADTGCADARPSRPVSYCPSTNTIGVDLPALADRGAPRRDAEASLSARISGDYLAYVEFGSRYALAVQRDRGLRLRNARAALRTACLSGVFTAGLADERRAGAFTLAPGGLDKAISGLLTDGLAASDTDGTTVPSGFARIDAFRWGVQHTETSCTDRYS